MKLQKGANTILHVYFRLNTVYEVNGSSITKHYYAIGLHMAENRGGTVEYFHQDHLGSTRLKTDSTGGAVYEANYVPFGPAHGESDSEEFKYTGKHEDPSGLYYFGARYYDPGTGRFITEDPVTGSLGDPQGLNRYVYCRNNPHKYTDPDGRLIEYFFGVTLGLTVVYMGHYTWGAFKGDYDFSAREFYRAGLEGAMTGGTIASGIILSGLAGGGLIVKTIVSGLGIAVKIGVIPGVLGAYDILTGEDSIEVRERTQQYTRDKLQTAPTDIMIDVSDTSIGEDCTTIDIALYDESLNDVSMPQTPLDYMYKPIVIPTNYIDAKWR